MWLWFCVVSSSFLILRTQARIIFQRIEKIDNNYYMSTNYSIINRSGQNYLNCNISMFQALNGKITAKTDIYFQPNLKTPAFSLPKVNYCDATALSRVVPFLSDVIVVIEKFANSTGVTRCPMIVGDYQLVNISVENTAFKDLFWLKKDARYMIRLLLQDENGKAPQLIHDIKYFVTIKEN